MTLRMHFLGVSTGGSRIMRLFPRWMAVLGLDAEIVGRDLPIGGEPGVYRGAVDEIGNDEAVRGALVTTHKVDVFRHAGDRFADLDGWARLCREVSCISKGDGGLIGHAKDPITSWRALQDMLGAGYFADHPEAEVFCMGAGGSGTAITSRMLTESGTAGLPARIVVTNRSAGPLQDLRRIHEEIGARAHLEYRAVSTPADSDAILHSLPPASLVINATGMGKDIPGSPLSDTARFPERGVAWDLNYRGDLRFLEQARRQAGPRRLSVHDGWGYFLHGWGEHIAEVFGVDLDRARWRALTEAAAPVRP